jgi:endonuclease YncB( thermonuclease family)
VFAEDGSNLSVALVEAGYACVHRGALGSPCHAALAAAEARAKERRLGRWKGFVEEAVADAEEVKRSEPAERVVAPKKLIVTEVCGFVGGQVFFAVEQF